MPRPRGPLEFSSELVTTILLVQCAAPCDTFLSVFFKALGGLLDATK